MTRRFAPKPAPFPLILNVNNFFEISICKPENFLNFPPPPYNPRWFSSQIRRQAEWPDQRIAVQQKAGSVEKPHERTERNQRTGTTLQSRAADYGNALTGVFELLDTARQASACIVNTLMTATYWEICRRIVEHEQAGQKCAAYGEVVAGEFCKDLTQRFRRGFGPAQIAFNIQ